MRYVRSGVQKWVMHLLNSFIVLLIWDLILCVLENDLKQTVQIPLLAKDGYIFPLQTLQTPPLQTPLEFHRLWL
jgi:hypothetical protein